MSERQLRRKRARLLRLAKGVQWVGLLWNLLCWGYAVWVIATSASLSDGIGNALVIALVGGLGFALAWLANRVLSAFALLRTRPRETAPPAPPQAASVDRDDEHG
jgi:hypothetical protein